MLCFRKFLIGKKFIDKAGGGGGGLGRKVYQGFSSRIFCPLLPKKNV